MRMPFIIAVALGCMFTYASESSEVDKQWLERVKSRSAVANGFNPSCVKFKQCTPLDNQELREFTRLCDNGVFVLGRYSFIHGDCILNNSIYKYSVPNWVGKFTSKRQLLSRQMLISYNPFDNVLYISDDWDDDYGNGLIVSNMPHRLVRYPEWDDQYPRWMECNVDTLKQCLENSHITIKVCAFTPHGVSVVYRYFVPYMYSTFGTSIELLSNEAVPFGEGRQRIVNKVAANRRPDEIDITIGDIVIHTDEDKYMHPNFFIQLTNALIRSVNINGAK